MSFIIEEEDKKEQINNTTLLLVRWATVLGQTLTLLITSYILKLPIPLLPALLCVFMSCILNTGASIWHKKKGHVITDTQATLYLSFDIIQVSSLIFLTGGISNPFAILIITPVAVGATLLPLPKLAMLSVLAVLSIETISLWYIPLPYYESFEHIPALFIMGEQLSLIFAVLFFSLYIWWISSDNKKQQASLHATQLALSRQKQMNALNAQAAAATHELGSPLSTIAIIVNELKQGSHEDIFTAEDLDLLLSQVTRCSKILQNISGRPPGNDNDSSDILSPQTLIEFIAEPFLVENSDINLTIDVSTDEDASPLRIRKNPEIIFGLGTIIQNAVQFANAVVRIHMHWDKKVFKIEIKDDGPGFPDNVLSKIGRPYISTRKDSGKNMGLGIFIAQNLLESKGAEITFQNGLGLGAIVDIKWDRTILEGVESNEHAKRPKTTGKQNTA